MSKFITKRLPGDFGNTLSFCFHSRQGCDSNGKAHICVVTIRYCGIEVRSLRQLHHISTSLTYKLTILSVKSAVSVTDY